MLSNSSPQDGLHLTVQPLLAWMAILMLVLFSALCILVGAGSILRLAFPVSSFAVGVFLYWRYPILYLGFTWWMWFLTPLVARLVDYRSGWDPQRLILISPYLITLLTFASFFKHLPRSYRQGGLPFILAFTGVFYAFVVGLIKSSPFTVARALLDWLAPLLFGFHLFVNWRNYPSYRQNIQRTFLWAVLVTGVYGVLQYLVAPEWDRFWLVNTKIESMGIPEPLGLRVWSTMHSPGPFSTVIMAGLVLLFNSQETLGIPAAVVGYLAFLLSLVRTMWGAWFVALLTVISSLKARLQMRLIITILVMAVCVFPLTTIDPFSKVIGSRFQTFSNLENDSSFTTRAKIYEGNINLALSTYLGSGIGNKFIVKENGILEQLVIDNGLIDMFFTLGWFGSIPYLSGLILLFLKMFQSSEIHFDYFMSAARAISLSIVLTLFGSNVMLALSGIVIWGFLGMGMAAQKYYQHQRTARLSQSLSQKFP